MDLPKLSHIDLCAGIGACSEGLSQWAETIAYCENDPAKQDMLLSRMHRGEIDRAPIWDDLATFRGEQFRGACNLVSAGFPCTDISLAGRREGLGGKRSSLFWEVVRFIAECEPEFAFFENVWPGIRPYVPTITAALEELGFRCRDGFLSAADVGAAHERDRWFLLAAHPDRLQQRVAPNAARKGGWKKALLSRAAMANGQNPYAYGERMALGGSGSGIQKAQPFSLGLLEGDNWDEFAAFFLRVDHGLSHRLNRRRALGDTNPPILYKTAWQRLNGIEEEA